MSDDRNDLADRAEAVLSVFRRGAEFTKELLDDNHRLRSQLRETQERQQWAARDDGDWAKLRTELLERIDLLESENESMQQQLRAIESENQQFAARYVEIEEENNNLANLYVASYQLHSTLDPNEVLKVILEIVINLIGAEIFCVYLHDQKEGALEPVVSEGAPVSHFPRARMGEGFVGGAAASGDVATRDAIADGRGPVEGGEPLVAIPLCVDDRAIGAIAIYSLLAQKEGFSALDHELFTLLAGHAATAIFASQLYSQSERKLNTIQGFIDLLTK
ncbi:MAG: GAF domain-containing protein [Myxococcota bacterium]|nr:GAF domain-containing protein [Myxococcales bacterium]